MAVRWAVVRTRTAALVLVLATALPRLAALLHARSSIITDNVDKGDTFARTYLATGTYGFIPGHPSAYTQPLYGWFLIPLYWIFGRHWIVVGLAQILVAVGTTLIVWQIGRRWLTPTVGLLAGLAVALHPYLVWHDVHMNREILDHFLAAATVFLTLWAAERFGWRRALPLGAVLGIAILGNVRLEALPLVVIAYLLWRAGLSRTHRARLRGRARRSGRARDAVGRAHEGGRRLLGGDDRLARALEGEQRQHVRDARRADSGSTTFRSRRRFRRRPRTCTTTG